MHDHAAQEQRDAERDRRATMNNTILKINNNQAPNLTANATANATASRDHKTPAGNVTIPIINATLPAINISNVTLPAINVTLPRLNTT